MEWIERNGMGFALSFLLSFFLLSVGSSLLSSVYSGEGDTLWHEWVRICLAVLCSEWNGMLLNGVILLWLPSFVSCSGVMGSDICGALLNRVGPGSLCDAFALGMAFVRQGPSSRVVLQHELTSCPGRRSGGCIPEVSTTTTTVSRCGSNGVLCSPG